MKNKNTWQPTKFVKTKSGCVPNNNTMHVSVGSRFITGILGELYHDLLKKHATGVLLDLGCGNVPLYDVYREYVTDNICIDWNKNPYLDYETDFNNFIPLESNTFDTILCTDVLEHIAEPHKLFGEMARLLKPNGKLILAVPFYYWIHEEPHDYFRYTRYALQKFCKDNKLIVVELNSYGGIPEIIIDIISKNVRRFRTLSNIILRLSHFILNTQFAKNYHMKTRQSFPLGYYLVAQKP
ncbi:MAG: class I SAM-dependent methyltransferase [Nitrospirae bacterium]|nr:class I SAM-dependent methyltransferase [Nitrospirota bacterium]